MADRASTFLSRAALGTVAIVASYALIVLHTLLPWNNENHARQECRTVAEIATQLAQSSLERNRTVEFSAVIAGSPFTASLPHRERTGIFRPMDCSRELSNRGVRLAYMRFPHFVELVPPSYDRYSFSRLAFSNGDDTAYFVITLWCGDLCGTGTETVWRLQNGRWLEIREKLVWLS